MLPDSSRTMFGFWPVPMTKDLGEGVPPMSMSAPTQPDGPAKKVTLYQVTVLPVTVTGPAVTEPVAFLGCVPTRVPSAAARTLVVPVVATCWPTVKVGVNAEVEVGEIARRESSAVAAKSTDTMTRAGTGRFMVLLSRVRTADAGRRGAYHKVFHSKCKYLRRK